MAKRKTSKRGRSRRSPSQRAQGEPTAEPASTSAVAAPERATAERPTSGRSTSGRSTGGRSSSGRAGSRDRRGAGGDGVKERPEAPWHPLPLSELLILVGLVGVMVAVFIEKEVHPALLLASIAAVAIGTVEVTLREHLGGYRSHTVLLALIPVVVLHSAVLLIAGAFTSVPRWVNIPLLALDIAIFSLLYKVLRLRYLDAKRERRFAA